MTLAYADTQVQSQGLDFSGLHQAMHKTVQADLLTGVSSAVLRGRTLVDLHCTGLADRERNEALRPDHLFRIFSNTKLFTSCAVLLLWEEGRLGLDDPIERFIPQLGARQVLRAGATAIDQVEPARSSITVRHLLTHSSGLSYGLLDPGTVMFKAYTGAKVLNAATPLSAMMDVLAELPLSFHPGTAWEYSVATDVLSRLVEVVSGKAFDVFLAERIFAPLGMTDTGFVVPAADQARLVGYYAGASLTDPLKPGLTATPDAPYPGAYLRAMPRLSGGGGLVSSLPDMIALMRGLIPGEPGDAPTLLKPATIELMMRSHLPDGTFIRFPTVGEAKGKAFGLGGAVTLACSSIDPPDSEGEFQWGGIAGTHWWINPRKGLAGLVMAQRQMAFWHPFSFGMKRAVYAAAG
jgi:CubicO group peptidase (beta-lactamase class C family)